MISNAQTINIDKIRRVIDNDKAHFTFVIINKNKNIFLPTTINKNKNIFLPNTLVEIEIDVATSINNFFGNSNIDIRDEIKFSMEVYHSNGSKLINSGEFGKNAFICTSKDGSFLYFAGKPTSEKSHVYYFRAKLNVEPKTFIEVAEQ